MQTADEDIDIRDEIRDTNDAFMSASTPKYLEELKLEPYTLMRQAVGMELAGPGASIFVDALMRVWCCTQDEEACLDAREDRRTARKAAFKWGEARGYSPSIEKRWQPLMDIKAKLDAEIEASLAARLAPGDGNGAPTKNSIGQPQ
jgi:hypothetical protein